MDWSEPRSFREWLSRLVSLRCLLTLLIVYCLALSELRFDWVERSIGAYLVTTNPARPRSGHIWEKSRDTVIARKTLEKIVTDRQASQRSALDATNLVEMVATLPEDQGAMLSADRFRGLYRNLPDRLAADLMSPIELLRLSSSGKWARAYLRKQDGGLKIYLLDPGNRVLKEIDVLSEFLRRIEREGILIEGALEDIPGLTNRLYPAQQFFSALEALPKEARIEVLDQPETLLSMSNPVDRVGISDEALSGFIDIGFEFLENGTPKVILVQARDWAVWQLSLLLEGEDSPPPEGLTP
ncbi:hypothetical protein D3OALGA1CA_5814 [Olavius algarvensis associated proteobacterium Delta 3]|nr:hypothetical protein D3OALGB2SA_1241 [Olavius algarvensis associated proteobacterium Delta 3]CAB5172188.1 hypothetical protein D3OALGA1CA_5814 [Olavius algarvensis associated proteobacterium Delta 3]